MTFESNFTRMSSLAFAALISFAGAASAGANCPQGATCKCVPTKFTECTADSTGKIISCKQSVGEVCTVVSGPGSGKAAALTQATPLRFSAIRR